MAKIIEKRANGSTRVHTIPEGPTMTQQNLQAQTDVNLIMERYQRTGQISHLRNSTDGVYANLADIPDFQTMKNQIIQAENTFNEMPAKIRQRFSNNPQELITFLQDPNNVPESIKLGLRTLTKVPPPPSQTPPTPPTTGEK